MRAVYSSTNEPMYSFFTPITAWCWHKLGIRSLVFVPLYRNAAIDFALKTAEQWITFLPFHCPDHKQATYAQCSRLYAACLDLPEDEVLVTSDVDMAVFTIPPYDTEFGDNFTIFGNDLVPNGQVPICYISAKVKEWRKYFQLDGKTYQQCLDELLGHIETEHFRGNYWGKDQETAFNKIIPYAGIYVDPRARPGTQFASHRVDRDDINWRHYVDNSLVDAHLWRPGYEENNFNNIMELLQIKYPYDNFDWLIEYQKQYKSLL